MHTRFGRGLRTALLALACAAAGSAQVIPFTMTWSSPTQPTTPLGNGSDLTLTAAPGISQTVTITAQYIGTGTVRISSQPIVSGSAFTATIGGSLPLELTQGGILTFTITYAPPTALVEAGQLTIVYDESPASTGNPIALALQGVPSAVIVGYLLPGDNNVVRLLQDSTLPFPDTLVGSTSLATINFTNISTTRGQVTGISATGEGFRIQNVPFLPIAVAPNETKQVQVAFRPTGKGPVSGTVTVDTADAEPFTFRVTGTGVAAEFTYQAGDPPVAVAPGGTIRLPSGDVGQTTTSLMRITNSGDGTGTINTLNVVGLGFQVLAGPVLPQTVAPGESVVFTLAFSPVRGGAHAGTLVVNSHVLNLAGEGLLSGLSYSYVSGGNTIVLGPANNSIIFSPVRISSSAEVILDIRNTGLSSVPLINLGIGAGAGVFSIANPPALPLTIAPSQSIQVRVKFEPTAVGFTQGTLIADGNAIGLTGSGLAPPPLPAYTISGATGTQSPLSQPRVSVKLAEPYPVALTGTLTLTPTSTLLPADPAVQFATGGRTVNFRIPANSTDAIFGSQGTQAGLQTGTVAGAMLIVPTFATQAGNVDLTPADPPAAQFTVNAAAPALLGVQVVNATAAAFTVQVTGFTTTRTLTSLKLAFTTASGFKMPTKEYNLDLRALGSTWFQSTGSQAFGGQFRVSIPFTFQVPEGQSVLTGISSVSVTASNESGTSNTLETRIQ